MMLCKALLNTDLIDDDDDDDDDDYYYYYYYYVISLLTYSKQIAIYKLKVEKRTFKTYLQFISIKREYFQAKFFFKEKKTNVIKLQCYSYLY